MNTSGSALLLAGQAFVDADAPGGADEALVSSPPLSSYTVTRDGREFTCSLRAGLMAGDTAKTDSGPVAVVRTLLTDAGWRMPTPILQPGDEIVMRANSGTGLYRTGDQLVYRGKTGDDRLIVASHDGEEIHTSYMEKHLEISDLGTSASGGNVWAILPCNAERAT